ncbi:hypothetical protein GCM10027395_23870 [Giesbergeria sinuosa]
MLGALVAIVAQGHGTSGKGTNASEQWHRLVVSVPPVPPLKIAGVPLFFG